ncbi:MAG TPA: hypothetical protein VFS98_06295 [Methylomirabilota bacterium]|jgi:hypothetical protein|nr:hypothetical protein [Methylomirabilota bacterium]
MTRRFRRLARRSRAVRFMAVMLRSYREGRRRGQSRLAALRFGRAVARWRRHNGASHP